MKALATPLFCLLLVGCVSAPRNPHLEYAQVAQVMASTIDAMTTLREAGQVSDSVWDAFKITAEGAYGSMKSWEQSLVSRTDSSDFEIAARAAVEALIAIKLAKDQ